jgi:polyisoprenoid-binding protein YceI
MLAMPQVATGQVVSRASAPVPETGTTGLVANDSTVVLMGVLTIKGHARPVTLSGQYRGIAEDREGHERIAFDATTTVDRRDYGISWNETVAGSPLIGNEVDITIAIEAVRVD